ncbi:MAG: hypothetical protein MZV64_16905 [Ignavibacteriales bacterium]|nr:hypothetical protein [Ignavibacteriales bacterium]
MGVLSVARRTPRRLPRRRHRAADGVRPARRHRHRERPPVPGKGAAGGGGAPAAPQTVHPERDRVGRCRARCRSTRSCRSSSRA